MVLLLLFTIGRPIEIEAESTYPSYNYSYWEDSQPSAVPYLPEDIVDGIDEEYGRLSSPEDVFVTKDNEIFIADSGNNRILIFNEELILQEIIEEFQNGSEQDHFNYPQGVFVTDEGDVYIADTNNQRIVELDRKGNLKRIIGEPTSDVIRTGFEYYPMKIAVDQAKRIYVIGR